VEDLWIKQAASDLFLRAALVPAQGSKVLHAWNPTRELHAFPVSDRPIAARHRVRLRVRDFESRGQHGQIQAKDGSVDTWMGTSNGHWEGDTVVVDVSSLNGNSWFDRSGNFQSENTHVVERFTLSDADHINYE
jgi:hypothetical protein